MALEYTLSLAVGLSSGEAVTLLSSVASYRVEGDHVAAPGIRVLIRKAKGLSAEVIRDAFSFRPATEITFRLDKFGELRRSRRLVVQATLALLRETRGNAVLLFNGEVVILQYKDGKLLLNDDKTFWSEDMLGVIDRSYELIEIANL